MYASKPTIYTKKSILAYFKNLEKLTVFIGKTAQQAGFGEDIIYRIQLAVDEACSNIIEHGYGGETHHRIECICSYNDGELTIKLMDQGKTFNPDQIPEPDTKANLEERNQGGLGVFFIRQLMDEVSYTIGAAVDASSETPVNILTMVKRKE